MDFWVHGVQANPVLLHIRRSPLGEDRRSYSLYSQTVLGSAKMVKETQLHPGILKDQVCSPGGITIQGVKALEENNFRNAVMEAIDRSKK